MEKNVRFNSMITDVEKINPLFSRASLRALYVGSNRNGSYISKESVEDAIKKIYNVPIVGEFIEEDDNFGGHGGEVIIKDNEMKFKSTTMPYGVIPESASLSWEFIEEEDGSKNEYLVIDGAILWTGRYEELNNLLDKSFGQSMEIEVQNGNFAVVDGVETFKIDEFVFSAFCILGIDKDGEGLVEPCFESSNITAYSLDKDSFKKQFNQMIAELKFSMQGGNTDMTKENKQENEATAEATEVVKDYEKTEVEFEVAETTENDQPEMDERSEETQADEITNEETQSDNAVNSTETYENFEGVSSTEDTEENVVETSEAEVTSDETALQTEKEFSLTASQLAEQLHIALSKETCVNRWGETGSRYWHVDHTDTQVIYQDAHDCYQFYSATYVMNGDELTIDYNTAKKVKIEYVPFEGESTDYSLKLTRVQEDFSSLQSQLEELQSYKRQREEEDLKAKFEGKLSDEEFSQVFTDMQEMDLDKVEEKLFALIGKKNFSIESTVTKTNVNKLSIVQPKESAVQNPYGSIFED